MDDNIAEDAFNAGFDNDVEQAPLNEPVVQEVIEEKPAPEFAQITVQEYQDLVAKAAAIDEIRAEYGKKFDSTFGKLGNLQQLIEQVRSSAQQGNQVSVTEEDFEELIKEGYPDLAQMNAAAFNRILSKAKLTGTAPVVEAGINQDKVSEIFQNQFSSESAKLREQIREEMAQEAITEMHEDFADVVNSAEFKQWTEANKINETKDRKGVLFAESIDPKFVGKVISDFKASQKQAATRQSRIAGAVQPKGVGGHAGSSQNEDPFLDGFNG